MCLRAPVFVIAQVEALVVGVERCTKEEQEDAAEEDLATEGLGLQHANCFACVTDIRTPGGDRRELRYPSKP